MMLFGRHGGRHGLQGIFPACHCGLDPQSMAPRMHGCRIVSGMTAYLFTTALFSHIHPNHGQNPP